MISPYSVLSGVSLLLQGAGGDTRTSLQKLLHFSSGKEEEIKREAQGIDSYFSKLTEDSNSNFTLESSNKIFINEGFDIRKEYR